MGGAALQRRTLELVDEGGDSVICELVLMPYWKTKIATRLAEDS